MQHVKVFKYVCEKFFLWDENDAVLSVLLNLYAYMFRWVGVPFDILNAGDGMSDRIE